MSKRKLFCVKTKNGFAIIQDATIEYLETKLEFSLNDLVEAEIIKVGGELSRELKIKTNSEIYNMLTSKKEAKHFLVTVERTL